MELRLCHLYAGLLNIYGDRGNILTLTQRARWRGIAVRYATYEPGQRLDPEAFDLFFIGGGQDREQQVVAADLQGEAGRRLREAVDSGAALLAVCGGYQLLGHYFRTGDGTVLPGIGLFDAYTVAGPRRQIGDVVVESRLDDVPRLLVGFENHSGRTFLQAGARPLGRVLVGHGNNGQDGTEGAVYRGAIGTYLHGSLLPKNPWLADRLLHTALARRYGSVTLPPLDDAVEEAARRAVIARIRQRGKVASGVL